MIDHYESEILRLNKKIKELIGKNEQAAQYTSTLEKSNKKMTKQLQELHEIATKSTARNVKYKCELEKERTDRELLYDANQRHKQRLNSLAEKCKQLTDKIRTLEQSLRNNSTQRMSGGVAVEIPSQGADDAKKQIEYLEQKLKDTEAQLTSAHDMIDELEFELESVDYLESENANLRKQLESLESLDGPTSFRFSQPTAAEAQQSYATTPVEEPSQQNDVPPTEDCEANEKQKRRLELQKKLEMLHSKQHQV